MGTSIDDAQPATERPLPSSAISFPLDDFDRFLVDELIPNSGMPGRWQAFNAVRNSNRAWKLREIDPAMAAFRVITAEEEAAAALFCALRRLGYPGSGRLNRRNHVQKNAVIPFLRAVAASLAPALNATFPKGLALHVNKEQKPARIVIKLKRDFGGVEYQIEPVPPLELLAYNVSLLFDGSTGQQIQRPLDFGEKIAEHAAAAGSRDVEAYLRERANFRNRILYAADDGIPEIQLPVEPGLSFYRRNTFLILKVFLLVDGYEVEQSFARQCLLAFLKMLGRWEKKISFE